MPRSVFPRRLAVLRPPGAHQRRDPDAPLHRRLDVTSAVFAPNEQYVAIRDLYGKAVKHDAQSLALVRR